MSSSSSSLGLVLRATAEANLSVAFLVLMGAFFAFKGVFDSKGVSDLGKLVYHVSLPCLLFTKILYEFTIKRLALLWILPLCALLHVASGYVIGMVLSRALCVKNAQERRVCVASTMFGNVGALAIAVMDSLCHSESLAAVAGSQRECSSIAISYIAFYLITQNVLMFTWGETLMVGDEGDAEGAGEGDKEGGEGSRGGDDEAGVAEGAGSEADDREIYAEETGGLSARRLSLDAGAPPPGGAAYLCRVSTDRHPAATPRPPSLARDSYTVKLGYGGLRKVQSHLALEFDHSIPNEVVGSPTHKLRNAIEHYLSLIGGPRGDEGEGEGDAREALLEKGEGEEVLSPIERVGTFVRRGAESAKSTWVRVSDWAVVLVYRLARTPALQASLAAVVLASFPALKQLLTIHGGDTTKVPPLYFVYDAVSTLGQAQVPVSMIMLSGTATLRYMTALRRRAIRATMVDRAKAEGGDQEEVGEARGETEKPDRFTPPAVACILLGRTALMPLAGLGWWWALNRIGLVPDVEGHTPIMQLVILVESAVPTAQNVVMLLLVHGRLEKGESLAQLVLVQMAISVFTFTVSCSFFQYLVIPQ